MGGSEKGEKVPPITWMAPDWEGLSTNVDIVNKKFQHHFFFKTENSWFEYLISL